MRIGIPCALGLIFSMSFYNGIFDIHDKMRHIANIPFLFLHIGHFLFILTLLYGAMTIKNINDPSADQSDAIRQFQSLQIFGIIVSVPLCYMECKLNFNPIFTLNSLSFSPNVLIPLSSLHVL